MLTQHRKPVSLSLVSTDLPLWSVVETTATLYQKTCEQFHIVLHEPPLQQLDLATPRLLWLDISPYRVTMSMQASGKVSYRHSWQQGDYGYSYYWLQSQSFKPQEQLRLRNFTCDLKLVGQTLPENLRLQYELWSQKVQMGCYTLNLDIHH